MVSVRLGMVRSLLRGLLSDEVSFTLTASQSSGFDPLPAYCCDRYWPCVSALPKDSTK